ncbi:MAG: hypothetical protein EPO16_10875, partial [Dehalococcoidia bacterium]
RGGRGAAGPAQHLRRRPTTGAPDAPHDPPAPRRRRLARGREPHPRARPRPLRPRRRRHPLAAAGLGASCRSPPSRSTPPTALGRSRPGARRCCAS